MSLAEIIRLRLTLPPRKWEEVFPLAPNMKRAVNRNKVERR
jgi:hypothetical protein